MNNSFHKLFVFLIMLSQFFLLSCQSSKTLPAGIQERFEGINLASIIAVPVFILPNPAENTTVDRAIVASNQIVEKIQSKVLQSFIGQPNINGYPFNVVEKALSSQKPNIWNSLNERIQNIASRFGSRDSSVRSLVTSQCLARKSFIEFYSYCVSEDEKWLEGLNLLADKIMNADSALIVVVNTLESPVIEKKYSIRGGFSVLLVDTNNGKLIWGRDSLVRLENRSALEGFPSWDDLLNEAFNDSFWNGFPGRIQPSQNIKK